jgi:hypothetical protein
MSGASVRLSDRSAITFELVKSHSDNGAKRVLLTLEGRVPGEVLNCVLIPLEKINSILATLKAVAQLEAA